MDLKMDDNELPEMAAWHIPCYATYNCPGLATNSILFSLIPFCKNSLICLEGKSMTPYRGNAILCSSSQQLPRLRLGPLKGFFELTLCPSTALDSHRALLVPELQRNKDTA